MSLMLKVLPASNGDSIIIKYGEKNNTKNIIIDGGRGIACYKALKGFFKEVSDKSNSIELVVITHVDDDHINGILKIMQDDSVNKNIVKDVWFNSGTLINGFLSEGIIDKSREILLPIPGNTDMSIKQGVSLETNLEKLGIWSKKLIKSNDYYNCSGAIIKVLSPNLSALKEINEKWEYEVNKETDMAAIFDYDVSIESLLNNRFIQDTSVPNKSSIGFIFEYDDNCLLFLGDANPRVIIESLIALGYSTENKLKVDIVKVSHHGSKFNTCDELLNLIECKEFIISTNGCQHGLPHKECLARILKNNVAGCKFYFNYNISNRIFNENEINKYGINCKYLEQDEYIIVRS